MSRPRRAFLLLAPAAAAAALLLVVQRAHDPGDETRTKGLAPHLRAFLSTPQGAQEVRDGAWVHPHDVVQVTVVSGEPAHALVISVDAQGGVTLHLSPTQVRAGETALPHAFELDAAPGFERFFLVLSREPLDERAVLDAARTLARDPAAASTQALPLPRGLHQGSLLLRKVLP